MKTESAIDDTTLRLPLTHPVSLRGFAAITLGEALDGTPTLLVFLRHFG